MAIQRHKEKSLVITFPEIPNPGQGPSEWTSWITFSQFVRLSLCCFVIFEIPTDDWDVLSHPNYNNIVRARLRNFDSIPNNNQIQSF